MVPATRLSRNLSTQSAVILGLGSMIGAGIFSAAGPAAQAAGSGLLIAIVIAGCTAFLNASSVAQLAAKYPESGGAYAYGRYELNPFLGFLAGWGFVIGKIASCTAIALTFAYYVLPSHTHLISSAAVIVLTAINYFGIKKTAWTTGILVILVLSTLTLVIGACWIGGNPNLTRIHGLFDKGTKGILEASGIMFFAFAGYARIATLGEEVINPQKAIPKAILLALTITFIIYLLIFATIIFVLPIAELSFSKAPVALAVENSKYSFLVPLVRLGAALASLSVLLSLLAGISRTVFAMASQSDLPKILGKVHTIRKVPHYAEIAVCILVSLLVAFADLRLAIGFSSFAVLTYYAIANMAAYKLSSQERLYPKVFAGLGGLICVALALSLPRESVIGGFTLFLVGVVYYKLFRRRRRNGEP